MTYFQKESLNRATFFALLVALVFLIAGCGIFGDDGSDKEEFEPYQLGTWLVDSPTSADWQGANTKSKSMTMADEDTVIIEQPGQRHLELIKQGYDDTGEPFVKFKMIFIDSTLNNSNGSNITDVDFSRPFDTEAFSGRSRGYKITPDFFEARVGMNYFCERDVPKNFDIKIGTESDGNPFRMFIIKQSGFVDVLDGQFCE